MKRFWNMVDKRGPEDCWNWTGSIDVYGYGRTHIGYRGNNTLKVIGAHRLSWILHNGEIPHHDSAHGMCVLHRCDNPRCVNPEHLFLGTHSDNMQDMYIKGRARGKRWIGVEHPMAILDDADVAYIRKNYPSTSITVLAKRLNVKYGAVYNAAKRITWRHLES